MKQAVLLFFLLVAGVCQAQSLDLLTNLHPRPKVSYFSTDTLGFRLSSYTEIITENQPSAASLRAIRYLQSQLRRLTGDTLIVLPLISYDFQGNAIFIGEKNWPAIQESSNDEHWDTSTHPEGYILDMGQTEVLIAGDDSTGTFNGISTFVQLLEPFKDSIPPLHIHDWPDYPIRWVFSTHNLISSSQISALEAIEDTMAAHKLNGLQQNDFKNNIYSVFENSYPPYFYNVDSLQAYSQKSNVELIPGMFPIGWSEGILFHDPDLAEGFPTTSSYVIQNDSGTVLTDPHIVLPNGNFESVSNGVFTGWSFYDGPNQSTFVDSTTVHSGKYSARCTNFVAGNAGGNCRFERSVLCQPFHGYRMSVWFNSQNLSSDEVQLLAIGHNGADSRALTYTAFPVSGTSNGWNQYNVVFNTLTYDSLYVYCGVWGGSAGTIWFDDFQIEDAGLTNVLRRTSDVPLVTVRGKTSTYVEGKDYATIIDTTMEQGQGTYPWHPSPSFQILPGSAIKSGDTVDIHFIRPNPVENAANGDGSTMVCVSEDTLYPILHDQLQLVDSQYHANRYFMSHDEIREMNWDSACQNRNVSPAILLADNARKCDSIIHEVHPGADVFDWSDMFDSLHNAHNNYYLVNGDLTGDWNLLPKDITIVNWNSGSMSQSLDFFSKLGFSQITSPYYDVPNTVNIRNWRLAMDTIPNMRGMMYTTWANDYSFLTPFADYAWSAGPMIVHEPPNLFETITDGESVQINANVFADPYNPSDSIVKVTYTQYSHSDGVDDTTVFTMFPDTGHFYRCTNLTQGDPGTDVIYQIRATDLEGLTRTTPKYTIFHVPDAGVTAISPKETISIYPNPASTTITLSGDAPSSLSLIDALGRTVLTHTLSELHSTIDISFLPIGSYNSIVRKKDGIETKNLLILR